jgi:hypothetical protein
VPSFKARNLEDLQRGNQAKELGTKIPRLDLESRGGGNPRRGRGRISEGAREFTWRAPGGGGRAEETGSGGGAEEEE